MPPITPPSLLSLSQAPLLFSHFSLTFTNLFPSLKMSNTKNYKTSNDGAILSLFFVQLSRIRASLPSPTRLSAMLRIVNRQFRCLCSKFRWSYRKMSKSKVVIRRFSRPNPPPERKSGDREAAWLNEQLKVSESARLIRVATFNAGLFSMAPAIPKANKSVTDDQEGYPNGMYSMELDIRGKSANDRPRSILKQKSYAGLTDNSSEYLSKQQKFGKSKLKVSINLPDNEISLERSRQATYAEDEEGLRRFNQRQKTTLKSSASFPGHNRNSRDSQRLRSNRTVLEVLKEVGADILALQDVKAEEEKGMKPLSDLAEALGMKYVFAESWAPEYGNAVLSRWPIKGWQVQKIYDDSDFRNVLKVTVDVPSTGEVNFHCTHLDHLDENWRMKQIMAIMQGNDPPHILAGGLNSLDETDYSIERWSDIVKYYEEIGKPTPKVEVMKFLKGKKYVDAKNFAGECESVVIIAKGQDVQGTCKYGTRVDYILASPNSLYKFVPGSYSVVSSKGTSDHHIVKVDIQVANAPDTSGRHRPKPKTVKIGKNSSRSIWRMNL